MEGLVTVTVELKVGDLNTVTIELKVKYLVTVTLHMKVEFLVMVTIVIAESGGPGYSEPRAESGVLGYCDH